MIERADRRQIEALVTATKYLEEQLREQKASVARLQQGQDRLNNQLEAVLNRLDAVVLAQKELSAQYKVVQGTQAQIHKLADQVAEAQEKQSMQGTRVDELTRQRAAAAEQERQEREAAARRLDIAEQTTQTWESRMVVLEEIGKRVHEGSTLTAQRIEGIEQAVEALRGRVGRNLEAAKRLEGELRQIESLVDTLQRADEAVLERIQLLNEVVRRIEDEMGAMAAAEGRFQDVLDKIELQRVERLRVEEGMNRVDRQSEEQRALIAHLEHVAATLEGRAKGFTERLDRLVEETTQFREEVLGYLVRFGQIQERHKRRQIQDLETEIRDLKRHAVRTEGATGNEQQST